jgi:hypothetical protein
MSAVVDQTWKLAPAVLRKLDAQPIGKLEAWSTALLHNCVAYLPGLQRSVAQLIGLNLDQELRWRRGGRGEGDIAACTDDDWTAQAYIETKGLRTQVSYGDKCPINCGLRQSQYIHMSHRHEPLLVVAPRRNLLSRERSWRTTSGLPAHAVVMSFSAMADEIERSLLVDALPEYSLLEALYDVEKIEL